MSIISSKIVLLQTGMFDKSSRPKNDMTDLWSNHLKSRNSYKNKLCRSRRQSGHIFRRSDTVLLCRGHLQNKTEHQSLINLELGYKHCKQWRMHGWWRQTMKLRDLCLRNCANEGVKGLSLRFFDPTNSNFSMRSPTQHFEREHCNER